MNNGRRTRRVVPRLTREHLWLLTTAWPIWPNQAAGLNGFGYSVATGGPFTVIRILFRRLRVLAANRTRGPSRDRHYALEEAPIGPAGQRSLLRIVVTCPM